MASTQDHKTDLDCIHEYDIDPHNRELYLTGREELANSHSMEEPGVEYTMANRFIKNLRFLQHASSAPILVHMKTIGGNWIDGLAIYQAICACPNYVTIVNYAQAQSMSSLILQAGDLRVMMPHSRFMYHDGSIHIEGTIKQLWSEAAEVKKSSDLIADIYLDSAVGAPAWQGKTRAQIKQAMRRLMDRKEEVYLDAQQTIDHGFADLVFENWSTLWS